jgi:hypothetical protein
LHVFVFNTLSCTQRSLQISNTNLADAGEGHNNTTTTTSISTVATEESMADPEGLDEAMNAGLASKRIREIMTLRQELNETVKKFHDFYVRCVFCSSQRQGDDDVEMNVILPEDEEGNNNVQYAEDNSMALEMVEKTSVIRQLLRKLDEEEQKKQHM